MTFVLRRLASVIPVLLGITFVAFLLIHLIPGDPAKVILFGSNATPEQIDQLRAQQQQLAEFLRQQPENAIPLLAQLMGGTPMYQPPIAPNFGMVAGQNIGSMMGSSGFWDYLRSLGGNQPSFSDTPITGGTSYSDPSFTGTNP